MKTLELHYPMMQFSISEDILPSKGGLGVFHVVQKVVEDIERQACGFPKRP